ncbi:MAG: hypothetical protein AAGC73_09625 [Verrucomicrobiota bacterium]
MAKNKDLQPYWRPNVRISGTLPDIKVVRTDFIVNFIAFALVVITGVFLLQREYRTFVLNRAIASIQAQIAGSEADNDANIELDTRFRDAAEYVIDLQNFYRAPFRPYEVIAEVTRAKPQDILITSLSFRENVEQKSKEMSYSIVVGCEVPELTILNAFKSTLAESEMLNPENYVTTVVESFRAKSEQSGIFPCTINVSIKPPEKASKKKAKGAKDDD